MKILRLVICLNFLPKIRLGKLINVKVISRAGFRPPRREGAPFKLKNLLFLM